MPKHIYAFEQLSLELERAPFAALRALQAAGIRLSRQGWEALSVEARTWIVEVGGAEVADPERVTNLLRGVPPREITLWQRQPDPSVDQVPQPVVSALGPTGQVPDSFWQAISALDRYVLVRLSHNTRLLVHAITEIALRTRQMTFIVSLKGWSGTLAHCEVKTERKAALRLADREVLDGQACVLARVAGVRAARQACDLLDLHRETLTGVIEIGSTVRTDARIGTVLWQAHVSTALGAFFPAASLLAVTTAAAAMHDILVHQLGAGAQIDAGRLADEPWCVGWDDGDATTAG